MRYFTEGIKMNTEELKEMHEQTERKGFIKKIPPIITILFIFLFLFDSFKTFIEKKS
jgi:hypothetical protein